MRKTIEIILAVLTVLLFAVALFSCRHGESTLRQAAAQRFAGGFSCTARVTLGGSSYTVDLTRTAAGRGELHFTQPAALSSLTFRTQDNGSVGVQFNGLEMEASASSLPQSGIFDAMLGALGAFQSNENVTVKHSGQDFIVTGKTAAGAYRLTLGADGTPKTLEFPVLKLKAVFQSFQFG